MVGGAKSVVAALTALVVGASCASSAAVAPAAGPSPSHRGRTSGPDVHAARIVFSSERDGHAQIYVMAADGSGQVNLSHNEFEDTRPSCRADGTEVGFLRSSHERLGDQGWFPPKLIVLDASGHQVNEVDDDLEVAPPAASPDGLRAAVVTDDEQDVQAGIFIVDGEGVKRLTTGIDRAPSWSPDGERIAFQRDVGHGEWEIFVIGADGIGLQQLTDHQGSDVSPSWSPDGRRIAFSSSNRDGKVDADNYAMNADGTNQRALTQTTPRTSRRAGCLPPRRPRVARESRQPGAR